MKIFLFFHFPYNFFIFCIITLGLTNCQSEKTTTQLPLFESIPAATSKLTFVNRLRESPSQNVLTYEYFYNGAGVAVADFNNDVLPDIYLVSNLEANHLYLNQGDFQFLDISKISGIQGRRGFATGVSIVDINADGLMDIYLCKSGRFTQPDFRRNELFINQGNNAEGIPIFKESAKKYGLDIATYSTQAAFFDYDKDGDLDLFLINHGIDTYDIQDIALLQEQQDSLMGEMLFRNENDYFVEVTQSAGIINNKLGFGLGIGISDLNNDTYPDVYVSNDYSGKDHLYLNQRNGTFKESIQQLTNQISFYAMGNDIGDINNDGWMDIVNLDMVAADNYGIKTSMSAMNPKQFEELVQAGEHYQYMFNSLLLNNGSPSIEQPPLFSNIGQLAGISNTDWSWAPLLFDMDNSGSQDLFITNGIKRNIRNNDALEVVNKLNEKLTRNTNKSQRAQLFQQMLQQFPYHRKPNYFFLNQGQLVFEDITTAIGMDSFPTASSGAAYADFDLDGDLDLIVNNADQPAMLLKNNAKTIHQNHTLSIKLKGTNKNPFGIGAKITLTTQNQQQTKEVYTSRGYKSSVGPTIFFGLGKATTIDKLTILWPDGKTQTILNVSSGTLLLEHKNATNPHITSTNINPIFSEITKIPLDNYLHYENDFDDFNRESLLPHKMSNMGPASAIGDVNNDGTMDLFIGGAKGQPAILYLQQKDGQFIPTDTSIWGKDKMLEDVNALFMDVDKDKDLDLFIGSGSNEWEAGDKAYQLRFYENIGQGHFRRNQSVIPDIRVSTGVLAKGDMDGDGDEDLFVGGRQVPSHYPTPADSYILKNDSQSDVIRFTDITTEIAPFLKQYGMVTDAEWVDINGDERPDLLTVGEWMTPKVLLNKNSQLVDFSEPANLSKEKGWWHSLAVADFDDDGDIDIIGGNLGLNYKYTASEEAPFEVYTNDFDKNGSQDILLSYHAEGNDFPLRGRECSSNQMPFIKEKFTTYDAYGKATLQDIYKPAQLKSAIHYSVTNFAHCYFENRGDGVFNMHQLPMDSQISSVNAISIADFDKDKNLDILLAGNLYGSEVETPRNDASFGQLLKGDGKGEFRVVPNEKSGLRIKGEVRNLLPLTIAQQKQQHILVVKNKDKIQLIKY